MTDPARRVPLDRALKSNAQRHDYTGEYVGDLANVVDMDAIRQANLKLGVHPLGGASLPIWSAVAERCGVPAATISRIAAEIRELLVRFPAPGL